MPDSINRFVLPIHDRLHVGLTTYDAKDPDTAFPPIEDVRPPEDSPNVLIILLDDIGFGAASSFGGAINTPTADRLAASGLKLTRFHTTALCAPSRQALLTGRNHHTAGMGAIPEVGDFGPGLQLHTPEDHRPTRPDPQAQWLLDCAVREMPRGSSVEDQPDGPFDQWPSQSGFDYFYGFIGGETNQYYPALFEGTTPIEPPTTPAEGYHLTEDLADRAITWVRQQRSLMTDRPFFAYFAPGATHAPHHVPREWSDKYKGRFDAGWDAFA